MQGQFSIAKCTEKQERRLALGWINVVTFSSASEGKCNRQKDAQLQVAVCNLAPGVPRSQKERLDLLCKITRQLPEFTSFVLLMPAGFFGYYVRPDETWKWTENVESDNLKIQLNEIVASWPSSRMLAVGVDLSGNDQRQWWFQGGCGFEREIVRANRHRPATALEERLIRHSGYTLLGFVCGECYEWPKETLISAVQQHNVDVVAVSAHRQVNRTWEPVIPLHYRRWAFQRRFQCISSFCGAALAQVRGHDDAYVRNCDDWFVHRAGELFPGPRVGRPIY